MRFLNSPYVSLLHNHLVKYPTPIGINYLWSFGFLAGLSLVIQLVSGVCLVMHYTPHTTLAFESLEHIMRDVNYGWLFRYIHSNGASLFFTILYLHIGKALYFRSYINPRSILWWSGLVIFLALMATGFLGYVLPWGQMSFWGATVITNLFSAIPYIGLLLAQWLWGGFSIDNATLQRFFSLHYLLPFLISGLSILHLMFLHLVGSSNPLNLNSKYYYTTFYPYYWIKDWFGFFVLMFLYSIILFFYPNYLAHPDNYISANPLVTPKHIVPEWYFLPFYAILRAVPNKLGGVISMGVAILLLFFLPIIDRGLYSGNAFKPIFQWLFWSYAITFMLLGWLGAQVVEQPYVLFNQIMTICYFSFFLLLFIFTAVENYFFTIKYDFYSKKRSK